MQRFRGGLVFKAHRLRVSLNSRLESNKEREREEGHTVELVFLDEILHVLVAPPYPAPLRARDLRTTALQKCAAVPRRARIQGS